MALSPLILLESVIMAMQLLSFVLYLICSSVLYISSLISLKAGKVFLLYTFRLIINSPRVSLFFFRLMFRTLIIVAPPHVRLLTRLGSC